MTEQRVSDRTARLVLTVDRLVLNVARDWLAYVNVLLGIFVLLPFAAPALMAIGLTELGNAIYFFYSFLCHQLPQRSLFLFGHKASYSLAEIARTWPDVDNFLTLRQFIGTQAMGWKVAWSDRMVSLYGSIWVGGLVYTLYRQFRPVPGPRSVRVPIIWLIFAVIPMGLDGITHTINDALVGVRGTGFRDTNAWLQFLTGNLLPATFYAGDALGSFNNLARLVTGALFGFLTVWFIYPMVDLAMRDMARQTRVQLSSPRAAELGFSAPQADRVTQPSE